MRYVRKFEEFLQDGTIRKSSIDSERSKSLRSEARRRNKSLNESVEKIGVKQENANDYLEGCYNIIMFSIRAKMYALGYSSRGKGAHKAEVSFARELNFTEPEVQFLNQLRYFRNGILYYGKRLDTEYAEKVIKFAKKVYNRLAEENK